MSVAAYPVAGKQKSYDICEAFIAGCGGAVAVGSPHLLPGPAFFFGVDASNEHLWREARADLGREWFYCDNAYFDTTRQQYFRISKNRLQHPGYGTSDGSRFRALGIEIEPWRASGSHIVVCPQSDDFMRRVVGYRGNWVTDTIQNIGERTNRPIRLRLWNRDKARLAGSLAADLEGAAALVTWSSASAVTAVLAGVPVVVGRDCAAAPMAGTLEQLDAMPHPDREQWAGVLADSQWTLAEMRSGMAWEALQPERMAA